MLESITHVHINRLGTTPVLYLSFLHLSADFVEVLLKSILKVLLKLFYKGNYYLVPYSCNIYNQMSSTQDIQMFFMQRYICPHPIYNQTLIETSKVKIHIHAFKQSLRMTLHMFTFSRNSYPSI